MLISALVLSASCAGPPAPASMKPRLDEGLREMRTLEKGTAQREYAGPESDRLRRGSVPSPAESWTRTEDETVRFDETGVGKALSHETQETAVRRAKEDARAKAMRKGTDIFYGFSDYSSQMGKDRYEAVARFLFSSNRGLLMNEKAGEPECDVGDGVTTCRVRVRGTIVFKGAVDPAFQILDRRSGTPLGIDRSQYYEGEPVRIALSVSRDARLYVFSWDSRDNIFMVFPNRLQTDNRVKAGELVDIPGEGSGIAYRAMLPRGESVVTERLLVVAAKKELMPPEAAVPLRRQDPYAAVSMGKMAEVMRRLAKLERYEWTMQVASYEIRSRKARK
ncbi:MAG: DUF4384 domain-containing protein [Elusimicrobiota bacterium]